MGILKSKFFVPYLMFYLVISEMTLFAQMRLNIHNIVEEQIGNLPNTYPDNLSSTYNQFNARGFYKDFEMGMRGEYFNSSYKQQGFATFPLTQRYIRWSGGKWEATIGNYYGILGRGLTFRSFELNGVINEDLSFRRRYALSRDTDGMILKSSFEKGEFTALYGRPLVKGFPPGNNELEQRGNEVKGGEVKLFLNSSLKIGGTFLSILNAHKDLSSGFISLNLNKILQKLNFNTLSIDLYAEYAQSNGKLSRPLDFNPERARAVYFSTNVLYGNLGLSLEYKDYNKFLFGINDPPSLIKENYWLLLNRSTHVLRASGEKGWQVETFYSLPRNNLLTVNYSQAEVASFFGPQRYHEFFVQVDVAHTERVSTKYFGDYGKDISQQESNRHTWGFATEILLTSTKSLRVEYQWQQRYRLFSLTRPRFHNMYGSTSVYFAPDWSFGIALERSTDFLQTDNPSTTEYELGAAYWTSGFIAYHFLNRFDVNLFAGKRRGGPACTAGTCYEVLPFRGFEFRLTSRL